MSNATNTTPYGNATVFTDDGADDIWFTSDDTTANTSAQNNPYTFTSQRLDNLDSDTLQIMYYKNRYFDAETGRFLQRDSLGEVGLIRGIEQIRISSAKEMLKELYPDKVAFAEKFSAVDLAVQNVLPFSLISYKDGLNFYAYSRSNPLRFRDTFGMCTNEWSPPEDIFCGIYSGFKQFGCFCLYNFLIDTQAVSETFPYGVSKTDCEVKCSEEYSIDGKGCWKSCIAICVSEWSQCLTGLK